jgi:exodeoxyribonuclease-3
MSDHSGWGSAWIRVAPRLPIWRQPDGRRLIPSRRWRETRISQYARLTGSPGVFLCAKCGFAATVKEESSISTIRRRGSRETTARAIVPADDSGARSRYGSISSPPVPECTPAMPKKPARLTIASWNINSVRLRADLALAFLKKHQPDMLFLQETKCPDDAFPRKLFEKAGYPHIAVRGQKGYHGVATISRVPFDKPQSLDFCGKGDARHLSVAVDGVTFHNFYVPAGGDIPDRRRNEKFDHKLSFLTEMERLFTAPRKKRDARVVILGDLNIAPREHDVWSHRQLLDVVSHTPVEVEHLGAVQAAHDFIDVARRDIPEPEKIYSWWSYRARDWAASDRGRRLDHIWVSPALDEAAANIRILREARGWERPSDHVPVLMDLAID